MKNVKETILLNPATHKKISVRQNITKLSIVSHLEEWGVMTAGKRIIDLGCGTGGGSFEFDRVGAHVHGVDFNSESIAIARQKAAEEKSKTTFSVGNLMESVSTELEGTADLVIMQEIIEHVPNAEIAMSNVAAYLKKGGQCYITFPPYFSPVGGHHHYAKKPFRYIPWLHLVFPQKLLLSVLPQDERYREEVRTLNRITITGFEGMLRRQGWQIQKRMCWFIRPSISIQTGLPAISGQWLGKIKGFREFFVTGVNYLITKK